MTIHIQMLQDIATHARAMADSMQAIVDDCAEQLVRRKAASESEESILNEPFNKAAQNGFASGETLPKEVISALEDPNIIKVAYNAQFERVCLSRYLGHWLDPHQWRCTMVMAAYLTLPGRLADAAVALGTTEKKMEEGKDLIRYFSVPCKSTKTNGGRTRNLPADAPEKWAVYKQYAPSGGCGILRLYARPRRGGH